MKLPSFKSKPEAVPSKDTSRPVLTCLYLRVEENGEGWLEATDSYKAVRIPVLTEEGDTDGLIPVEALKEARKQSRTEKRGAVEMAVNGSVVTPNGGQYERPEGTWPKLPELWPDETAKFEIGFSARFLWELAQAFGEDTVRLSFTAGPNGDPQNLRPIHVTPLRGDVPGAKGLLMPIRLAG